MGSQKKAKEIKRKGKGRKRKRTEKRKTGKERNSLKNLTHDRKFILFKLKHSKPNSKLK